MPESAWEETPRTVWQVARPEPDRARALAAAIGTSPLIGQILLNRGIGDEDEARSFLRPSLADIRDPDLLPDLERGADRVRQAIRSRESIVVYGDYDVDGLTGTALLLSFLRLAGAEPQPYIPDRMREGYGLNEAAVRRFAADGVDLLITVDHGTTAEAEIALARELGLDVVVLDHHVPSASPPPANALVNPHLGEVPPPHPCGVGVAFKLVWGLARLMAGGPRVSDAHRAFLIEAMALVALGTVADVMPLRGENRVLTGFGLKVLSRSESPGLRALLDLAGIEGEEPQVSDVAFRLAPRINAAGRMGRAELALELFTTDSKTRAEEIAAALDKENRKRQRIEREILDAALSQVEADYPAGHPGALVLGDDSWHPGVIGIVAARLVDRYHRPAAIAAFDGELGRGSCRSIPSLALPDALDRCAGLLESYGGHAAAAGFTIRRSRFPEFRSAFDGAVRDLLKPEDLVRKLRIDLVTPLGDVTTGMVRDLERLAPFGQGNPRPVLATRGTRVAGRLKRVGKEGNHLSFLATDGTSTFRAIGFRMGARADSLDTASRLVDIAYTPRFDTWRKDGSLELGLLDVTPGNGRVRD